MVILMILKYLFIKYIYVVYLNFRTKKQKNNNNFAMWYGEFQYLYILMYFILIDRGNINGGLK